jgi:hypothetical protein
MEQLTFEQFTNFLKSLSKDQIKEINELLLHHSYTQHNSDNAGLQPSQESSTSD